MFYRHLSSVENYSVLINMCNKPLGDSFYLLDKPSLFLQVLEAFFFFLLAEPAIWEQNLLVRLCLMDPRSVALQVFWPAACSRS